MQPTDCQFCSFCKTKVSLDWKPTIGHGGKVISPKGKISQNDFTKECYCTVGRWIKGNGEQDTIMLPKVMGETFKYNNERCPDFDGE
jgi:hypothetical protein